MKSYKELVAWQQAMDLARLVYRVTQAMPKEEIFGLRAQMRSAAVSVPSNIAEGYTRNHRPEYLQALAVAAGSVAELDTQAILAVDLDLIPGSKELMLQLETVGKLITGLRKSLRVGAVRKPPTRKKE